MAIRPCTSNTSVVSNLPDSPALTPAQLKAKFDEGATNVKTYINDDMIPDINGTITSTASTINTTINTNQTNNNTRFTGIETRLTTAESNITSLQSTTATHTSNISSLQTTVNSQANSISSLQTTVNSHTNSITSINNTLGTKANANNVYTKAQSDTKYQTKALYGTGNPSGGNNGDIYFKYI